MKYLKKFNESVKQSKLMDEYLWLPLFCTRGGRDLDCGIFTDKNMSGYGIGIRGDYFNEFEFERAISKKGDSLKRRLYTASDVDIMIKDLGLENIERSEAVDKIVNMIENTRKKYVSASPELERESGFYVELDEIKDMLI